MKPVRSPKRILLSLLLLLHPLSALPISSLAQDGSIDGVQRLFGKIEFGNPALSMPEDKPYMLLFDLTAYIERDENHSIDLEAQVLGPVRGSP